MLIGTFVPTLWQYRRGLIGFKFLDLWAFYGVVHRLRVANGTNYFPVSTPFPSYIHHGHWNIEPRLTSSLSVHIVLVPFLWNTWLITSSWNVNTVEKCRETSKNMHDAVQLRQFQRNPASVASHDELQGIIGSFKSNSLIDFSKQS